MATRPQFDDSERNPQKIKDAAATGTDSNLLGLDELAALREFLLLLDEWNEQGKSGDVQ